MRVGILHYTAPPIIGGVESTVRFQATFLQDAGHTVTTLAGAGDSFDPRIGVEIVPAINSRHPEVLAVKSELDRGRLSPAFERVTADLETELIPRLAALDVLIVHNALSLHKNLPLTAALWRLSADSAGPHWIAWHHDLAWDRPDYAAELHDGEPWDLLRRPLPVAKHVAVSESLRQRVIRVFDLPPDAVTVIPPGVDEASFHRWGRATRRIVEQLRLADADLLLLLPSRLTRRKNIALALRVIAELRRIQPGEVRLLITGPPGPHNPANIAYFEELRSMVRELDLHDTVHFLYLLDPDSPGGLDDATVSDLYRICDAVLFPSLDEGFGIPVLEAGLARIPVFCSDIPPFRESGGEWVTRFPLDIPPEAIAQGILGQMDRDRAYQLRRRVRRGFSWTALLTQRLLPLLEEGLDA